MDHAAAARPAVDAGFLGYLTTIGRSSGLPRTTPTGFVQLDDGTVLVNAGDPDNHWSRNLLVDPRCRFETVGRTRDYLARELTGDERDDAIARLAGRYPGSMPTSHGRPFALELVVDATEG
jgi:deazaflavin-dependent oxidoreductase (nitroreductase family)